MNEKWDERFLAVADLVGTWSKDVSTKVGAVIVRPDRTIASVGYNGFPRGVDDNLPKIENRAMKYPRTVHAELNAILSANEPVKGYTIYITPLFSCASCAGAIIQSGITRVVWRGVIPSRWNDNFLISNEMFEEANISCVRYTKKDTNHV